MPGFCVSCGAPLTGAFCNNCGARAVLAERTDSAGSPLRRTRRFSCGADRVSSRGPAAGTAAKGSGLGKVLAIVGGILLLLFVIGVGCGGLRRLLGEA